MSQWLASKVSRGTFGLRPTVVTNENVFPSVQKDRGGRKWRLSLKVTNRAECDVEEPMDVHLIVTIKSHDSDAQVYTEMVEEMDRLGWVVSNLEIRSRGREQL